MLIALALVACQQPADVVPDPIVDTDAPVFVDTFPDPVVDPGPPPAPASLVQLSDLEPWRGRQVFDLRVTAWTVTNPWLFADAWDGWTPELITTQEPLVQGCGVIARAPARSGTQLELEAGRLTGADGTAYEVPVKNCADADCRGQVWQVDFSTVGTRGEPGAVYSVGADVGAFPSFDAADAFRLPPEPFQIASATLRPDGGLDVEVRGLAGGSLGMIVHGSDPQPQLWCEFGTSATGTLPAEIAAQIADKGAWRVQVVRTERFLVPLDTSALVTTVEAWDEQWLQRP